MSHSTQTTDSNSNQPGMDLCTTFLGRLRSSAHQSPSPYVKQRYLTRFNVKCTRLDFNTGNPEDDGPVFLKLPPYDKMNAIAQENDFIRDQSVPYVEADLKGSMYEALCVGEALTHKWSGWVPKTMSDGKDMQALSPWDWCWTVGDRLRTNRFEWATLLVYELRDKSKLDTMCVLMNSTSFDDMTPFLSEIWCILRYSVCKVRDHHGHFLEAPVTIVSLSGRDARIVQGYIDPGANGLVVRMSHIIHLNQDKEKNMEGIVQLARWLFAEPCRESPGHNEEVELVMRKKARLC
ncbi:hypothetical protein F4810DRAFT_645911 [Camillea tinctor]|nr:hypothetical protein F4810DRAFT_645911 [Camillea tinctor]